MNYYFNMDDEINYQPKESWFSGDEDDNFDAYWDEETIRKISVISEIELDALGDSGVDFPWWPVYDFSGYSFNPVPCKSIDEAYRYMVYAFNASIYERRNDL